MVNLLKELIQTELLKVHPKVKYDELPEKKQLPIVIYHLPNSFDVEGREDFYIEIDIWSGSEPEEVNELETLTDKVKKQLDGFKYRNENIQVCFYVENRYSLRDEDENIKRRQLRVLAKTYFTN